MSIFKFVPHSDVEPSGPPAFEDDSIAVAPSPVANKAIHPKEQPDIVGEFLDLFRGRLSSPSSAATWDSFTNLISQFSERAAELLHLPALISVSAASSVPRTDASNASKKHYRRNRKRAVRLISGQDGLCCSVSKEQLFNTFKEEWPHKTHNPAFCPTASGRSPISMAPFFPMEVRRKLLAAESTAPGHDRLSYNHLRALDPDCLVITAILNNCLLHRKVPTKWKITRTVLIPKPSSVGSDPLTFRPITLCCTLYKLMAQCLNARFRTWVSVHSVLSFVQNGFTPYDGCLENNYVIEQRVKEAKLKHRDLCFAFLDIYNAFSALPHSVLFNAIEASGLGSDFLGFIKEIYTDNFTSMVVADGVPDPVAVLSGVRQGCPLSGPLFNLAIDPLLRRVQVDRLTILA